MRCETAGIALVLNAGNARANGLHKLSRTPSQVRDGGRANPPGVNHRGYLSAGAGYGEGALVLPGRPCSETARCASRARIWRLGRDAFREARCDLAHVDLRARVVSLQKCELFKTFSAGALDAVAAALSEKIYKTKGQAIVREGDAGDNFYLVMRGECEVRTRASSGNVVATCKPGDFFGERALLNDEPRAATVRVSSNGAACYVLTRKDFLARVGPAADAVANAKRAALLKGVKLFKGLDDAQRDALARCFVPQEPHKGVRVVRKGDLGDAFFVVESGEVEVRGTEDQVVAVLGAGAFVRPRGDGVLREGCGRANDRRTGRRRRRRRHAAAPPPPLHFVSRRDADRAGTSARRPSCGTRRATRTSWWRRRAPSS